MRFFRSKKSEEWIQTFTGLKFYPFAPRVQDVDIRDIAHALSNICRFTGHVKRHYSVGQHAILTSRRLLEEHEDPHIALQGLHHDDSEAYLNDVASPLKRRLGNYKKVEKTVSEVIYSAFGLPKELSEKVKIADLRMLATEKRDLMGPSPEPWGLVLPPYEDTVVPWDPEVTRAEFLKTHDRLIAKAF